MKMQKSTSTILAAALFAGVFALCAVLSTCTGLPTAGNQAFGGLGKPTDQVPEMQKLKTGTLPSGLTYFILENAMPENRACLTLAIKAGSVLETEDERGLAHFVEHMAFNGTTRFPEAELVNYLRSLGMRFGADANAYTSFDETVYGIETPVEERNGVKYIPDRALAIIDDWTRAITFAPADVDDERPVIVEEYRSRLGARERLQRQWLPVLFRGSPYADRLPIGKMEIVEGAPASRLEGFYKKWYRADNMALILVGDFDGTALETSLINHFSISKPESPTERPSYDLLPPRKGNLETLVLTDPELTSTQVNLYFKRGREAPRNDLAGYRNAIINVLIDTMLSFRFEDETVKPETPYLYAGAGTTQYGASSRFYVMMAGAKTNSAEASLAELLKAKETMLRYGFTGSELAIAGNALVSSLKQQAAEKDREESSGYVSSITDYYLNGGTLADVEWELDAVQKLLPHIGAKDINAMIKDYFNSNDLQVFIFAPEAEKAGLPSDARIRQMVTESAKMKIARPQDAVIPDEGLLPFTPPPGTITAENVDTETGAVIWTLSNGAQVILKETKNRNNEVELQALARGGTSSATPEDYVSARLASEMLQVSGLGPYSRPELTRKLADKQVSGSIWISAYYRGFQGGAATPDLETLFETIYLGFTDPRLDPEAVTAMMNQYRSSLARRDESPGNVFSDEVNRLVYGGHPHFKPLEPADLPKVDMDRALAFIRRGLNPADYTFVFTGNLNMTAFRSLVETYIASIPPSSENWNEWTNLNIQRPGKTEKNVYKGKEEQSRVYMAWFANNPYTEELSAEAQALTEYLEIKMTKEIREELGGVYSISVGVSASPIPEDQLNMQVSFACAPNRVTELIAAVNALLDRAASSALDQDTFTKSIEALKKEWEVSIQSNSYIAQSYANSAVLYRQPLSRLDRRPRYYDAVKPADIQRLCARLLRNGPATVVLYPEQK